MTQLPHHIIKKSRTYYYDTARDKYIRKEHLSDYVRKRQAEIKQLKLEI